VPEQRDQRAHMVRVAMAQKKIGSSHEGARGNAHVENGPEFRDAQARVDPAERHTDEGIWACLDFGEHETVAPGSARFAMAPPGANSK
jgi:hypothetical protein